MVETFLEAQLPLLGCALISAAVAKIAIRDKDDAGGAGMLAVLRRHRPVVVTVAAIEGVLGAALLVTAHPVVRLTTVVCLFIATAVVTELRAQNSEEGCGCFGGLSTTPVRLRTVLRAALFLLAAMAISVPGVDATGLDVIRDGSALHALIIAAELVVFGALSPEIGVLLARHRHKTPCEQRTVPLTETYAVLRSSKQWREHSAMIATADPVDVWRELCWRFLVYWGRADDQEVEIVFAVSTEERNPAVRAAIVNPDDSDTGPNPVYALSI
jgi:hypothetical protein